MSPPLSRRKFLASAISSSLLVFSGCSELPNSQKKPIEVTIFNVTEESHRLSVEILDEETPIIRQVAEIAAAEPNDGTKIETTLWLDSYPNASILNVRATLDQKRPRSNTIQLDCRPEQRGEDMIVRILGDDTVRISSSCI